MKTLLIAIVLSAFFISCNDESGNGLSNEVLRITNNNLRNGEVWVTIHDGETGEELQTKQLIRNETVAFETSGKVNKLAVAIAESFVAPDFFNEVRIVVFNDVRVGSEWTMSFESDPLEYIPAGSYSLTINNVPAVYEFKASGELGELYGQRPEFKNGTINGQLSWLGGSRQLLSLDPGNGKPRFAWIDNVAQQNPVVLNYNDMKEFDRYINVRFPATNQVSAVVMGYNGSPSSRPSFTLYDNEYWRADTQRDELNIGILDFKNYRFNIDVGAFHYASSGPLPKAIEYVDSSEFKINSKSIESYSITTSKDYIYSGAFYGYFQGSNNTSYSLSYYSLHDAVKQFTPMNADVLKKFDVSMEKFGYAYTTVTLKGRPYENKIDHLLNMNFGTLDTFEEIRVDVDRQQ